MTSGTLLFRQVNPSWVKLGRITSQAFMPTAKDRGRLSTYDGDRITAENSWRHYTRELGFRSAGVLAVTVGECEARAFPWNRIRVRFRNTWSSDSTVAHGRRS